MPYYTFKRSGRNRYLVLRWKKRINGIPTIVREVSVGTAENLASMLDHGMDDLVLKSYSAGSTLSALYIDAKIGFRDTVNAVMGRGKGMSPGDYMLLFIMNRLSDPCSKNGIEAWMERDYASVIFPKAGSQDFWNVMARFSDEKMKTIMDQIRNRLIALGYDFSRIFVDASNMYTFMEENGMAKKGHNKAHRYDLNQVSYYIAANYDYIPLFWNAYAGNVHDSQTFPAMVREIPPDATVIFDRGYNSRENVGLLHDRRYIGALTLSDHKDLMDLHVGMDSFTETEKVVYGSNHRIIVYHSLKLQKKRVKSFMKRFKTVYMKARRIIESGDSDALEKARFYLESEKFNETILLPDLRIDHERMRRRLDLLGRNALFTSITDMKAAGIMDLYRKRNRVEHCFRTINTLDLAFPVYHWTAQKIRVHMFFSLIAYLFLALIYNEIHAQNDGISLISTAGYMKDMNLNYAAKGKMVTSRLECKSPESEAIRKTLGLESMIKS